MSKRMFFAALLVLAALAVGLSACGGDGGGGEEEGATDTGGADTQTPEEGAGGDRNVNVELEEQNGSGQSGTATLSALGEGKTRVTIQLSNPGADPQPAHIHPGTCDELDPTPAFPLDNVAGGMSDTEVDVALDELQANAFAINVHKSEAEVETYVSCGNVAGGGAGGDDAGGGAGY